MQIHIEVRPKFLIPDTNCFVDSCESLIRIAESYPRFQLLVPLVGELHFGFLKVFLTSPPSHSFSCQWTGWTVKGQQRGLVDCAEAIWSSARAKGGRRVQGRPDLPQVQETPGRQVRMQWKSQISILTFLTALLWAYLCFLCKILVRQNQVGDNERFVPNDGRVHQRGRDERADVQRR